MNTSPKKYEVVGLGGSFDHFHAGHAEFLATAGKLGRHVHIGVSTDSMIAQKKYADSIQPYEVRKNEVKKFCRQNGISCVVFELTDPIGPTLEKTKVEALVVTEETAPGADHINHLRHQLKLPELPVHLARMIRDESGQILHAVRIRAGEVDRGGLIYARLFTKTITLNDAQREYFTQPQGDLIENITETTQKTVLVGDATTAKFLEGKIPFDLAIIDGHEQRQKIELTLPQDTPTSTVKNPAGQITSELATVINQALHQAEPQTILVEGEEDLATIAVNLLAPLGTKIYYGQPNVGLVKIEVSEDSKTAMLAQLS